jgi:hypothetical protein
LYKSPSHTDFGRKFLYLKQSEEEGFSIIAEKWYKDVHNEDLVPTHNLKSAKKNDSNIQL